MECSKLLSLVEENTLLMQTLIYILRQFLCDVVWLSLDNKGFCLESFFFWCNFLIIFILSLRNWEIYIWPFHADFFFSLSLLQI